MSKINDLSISILQDFSNSDEYCSVGRIVSQYRKTHFFEGQKRWNHLFNVIKLYLFKDWSGELKDIEVKNGLFFKRTKEQLGPPVELEVDRVEINQSEKTKKVIISDFDDTIIKSRATSLIRLVLTTLFKPVGKREVFPEVSNAYSKLQKGRNNDEDNLFFYISSSTWNIYPLLRGFLDSYLIPKGILLLKEMDFGNHFKSELKHSHKLRKIQFLLDFYPELDFILIGDAGQEDVEIYSEIARKNPSRISRILIRYKWWEKILENSPVDHDKIEGTELTYFKDLNDLEQEDLS